MSWRRGFVLLRMFMWPYLGCTRVRFKDSKDAFKLRPNIDTFNYARICQAGNLHVYGAPLVGECLVLLHPAARQAPLAGDMVATHAVIIPAYYSILKITLH